MKNLLLSMATVSILAVGAPAAAQDYRYDTRADARIDGRIGELQSRLDVGVRQGSINRREAQLLRSELRELGRLERRYARDGLSRGEREELQVRIQSLRRQIRSAEMNGGGRYDSDGRWSQGERVDCPPGLDKRGNGCLPPGQEGRDGRWEDRRDDRDGRWQDRDDRDDRDDRTSRRWDEDDRIGGYDRNRDGRDDRDTNRDGRIDSRDGGYQERNGGIGGIIDRVTGGGGLRIGQRVSGGLQALPYEYRNQYRDGDGVYHRTDGRNIYQIDARTDVVLKVYAMRR